MLGRVLSVSSLEQEFLSRYLLEIRAYSPLLSEEERRLAESIRRGDMRARDSLVRANLSFVVSVAKQYVGKGMGLLDLICEGNVGLLRAAETFDGTRGVRFITYAVWWIKEAIKEALSQHSRTVRLPLNVVAMLGEIGRASRELEQVYARSVIAEEIAGETGIGEERIRDTLVVAQPSVSLDAPWEDGMYLSDVVEDPYPAPDEQAMERMREEDLEAALSSLDPREAEVVRSYFGVGGGERMTLERIGARYGVTRERIRQIRDQALERLRSCARGSRLESHLSEQAGLKRNVLR